MIEKPDWHKEVNVAITVCDEEGIILYMNDKARKTFEKYGGNEIIGKNVLDCHPEPARSKLRMLMDQKIENTYTIEKNGVKKLIHQSPYFVEGEYRGFVELSIVLPNFMPNYIRS